MKLPCGILCPPGRLGCPEGVRLVCRQDGCILKHQTWMASKPGIWFSEVQLQSLGWDRWVLSTPESQALHSKLGSQGTTESVSLADHAKFGKAAAEECKAAGRGLGGLKGLAVRLCGGGFKRSGTGQEQVQEGNVTGKGWRQSVRSALWTGTGWQSFSQHSLFGTTQSATAL